LSKSNCSCNRQCFNRSRKRMTYCNSNTRRDSNSLVSSRQPHQNEREKERKEWNKRRGRWRRETIVRALRVIDIVGTRADRGSCSFSFLSPFLSPFSFATHRVVHPSHYSFIANFARIAHSTGHELRARRPVNVLSRE